MKGIACGKHGRVSFAQAVVLAGGYRKDVDEGGETIDYTGQGGNDTLGTKEQIYDQSARRARRATPPPPVHHASKSTPYAVRDAAAPARRASHGAHRAHT
eukprot:7380672-Prymnesium_polylepis.1